jgi:hypothetical protein
MWKEVVVAYLKYYPDISLEELKNKTQILPTTANLCDDVNPRTLRIQNNTP